MAGWTEFFSHFNDADLDNEIVIDKEVVMIKSKADETFGVK